MYVCMYVYIYIYIYILHIFVTRSANITYECLSVRGLKRENSMNIWQISGEGRVLMTVMARCTWWYVIRIRYVRKKTLELAWKLPSPRRINASRYRFPSILPIRDWREKGMKRFVSRMERKEIWMKIEVDCDDNEKIELF